VTPAHKHTNAGVGDSGDRPAFGSFKQSAAEHNRPTSATHALRAIIIGSNQATSSGVTARGHAPVLGLCRALLETGHDPDTPLDAYRGSTLCLRVRSIGEGARLTVKDSAKGRPRFVRYRQDGPETCAAASCVAQTGAVAAQAADHDREAILGGS
jgi:hypothetical protein